MFHLKKNNIASLLLFTLKIFSFLHYYSTNIYCYQLYRSIDFITAVSSTTLLQQSRSNNSSNSNNSTSNSTTTNIQILNNINASPECWLKSIKNIKKYIPNESIIMQVDDKLSEFLSYSGLSYCIILNDKKNDNSKIIHKLLSFFVTQCYIYTTTTTASESNSHLENEKNNNGNNISTSSISIMDYNNVQCLEYKIDSIVSNLSMNDYTIYDAFNQHISNVCIQLYKLIMEDM